MAVVGLLARDFIKAHLFQGSTVAWGLILASLTCGLDLNDPEDLAAFVQHRRNLFELNPKLHPVLAKAVARMTELNRHRRPQDVSALLRTLELLVAELGGRIDPVHSVFDGRDSTVVVRMPTTLIIGITTNAVIGSRFRRLTVT